MMRCSDCGSVVLTAFSIWIWAIAVHPVSCLRRLKKNPNSIIDVHTSCSTDSMNVTVVMEREFQGVLYARGFPLECRAIGSGEDYIHLQITASGCGVRMVPHKNGGLMYHIVLEVQMARHLQQATDPSIPASCHLTEDKMVLHSPALQILQKKNSRLGRRMGMSKSSKQDNKQEAKAWLEIEGSAASELETPNRVNVGEHTTLQVKTWLPESVETKVVDCLAHDGIGESSQQLTDNNGCPTDELLVPSFHRQIINNDSHNGFRMIIESTAFPAFKFPDRDAVHFRCGLLLCSGECPEVDCSHENEKLNSTRHNRKMEGEDKILDYIQLFNSVEVIAPGIEMDSQKQYKHLPNTDQKASAFSDFGDQPFCLSAPKMAMSFATLGMVFLAAVAISLYVLLRNRLQRKAHRRFTGFDVTSEQNLLVIRDSPSFSRTISVWSYGR